MKKVLRFLGILILILFVGYLVLCLATSSEGKVEASAEINAPASVVWQQVSDFNNWGNWSSWKEADTTIVSEVSGPAGQEGSKYNYKGKSSGEGVCTNMGVNGMEMKYHMDFITPFEGKADGIYKVSEEGGKTKVMMTYNQTTSFFMRGMWAIMGKSMLQKMFDRGFVLLKNYSEAHANDAPAAGSAFNIEETQFAAHTYAGVRQVIKWADMMTFYDKTYADMGKKLGSRIVGPASDIVYKWDEANQQADMHVGFPVADNKPVDGGTIVEVAASPAYMIKYTGGYSGSANAHMALGEHMGKSGKKMGLVIEEYIKGPGDTKDSNQYVTNIYYLYQ
ncbi:hypothetical protein CAP35_13640 [Chitinophagaceae bacterium IBVUCB1]|nr:hypothetical protein CAP35_13640 [Chitinophagaceae bacterium IBVUCB1]